MPKVLVIDDDELQLTLMRSVLLEEGYEVASTADGPHGIALYRQELPDLVLLDLGLPSMNGIAVLQAIREIDPAAKVIVVTGYGSRESAEDAKHRGALDFVEKTIDQRVFLEKVRTAIYGPDIRRS